MNQNYILRGGEQGAERLRLLAAVKWPTTEAFLRQAGMRAGLHCLDVGCGTGAVTLKLAEWTGASGRAVGMDVDKRCLELARMEDQRLGLNAEFKAGGICDLRESSAYDFVFGRFVLTHLPEPERGLERMVQAARPAGIVAAEDIQFVGHFCHPACAAFERYVALYQEAVRLRGGDPNIGPRLLGMFLHTGLTQIRLEMVQPTYRDGPGKRIAQVTMEHIREAVVANGLASRTDIDGIIAELDAFASDSRTIMSLPRIFQVWGSKA